MILVFSSHFQCFIWVDVIDLESKMVKLWTNRISLLSQNHRTFKIKNHDELKSHNHEKKSDIYEANKWNWDIKKWEMKKLKIMRQTPHQQSSL